MRFSSPLLPEALKEKNRRMGWSLFLLVLGLVAFSVVFIILDH